MDRTLERLLQKLSLPIRHQLQAVPASCWEQVQEIACNRAESRIWWWRADR